MVKSKFRKLALQLLTGVTLPLLLQDVNAADITKNVIVTSGLEYDSNPVLSETNRNPVWTYRIAPQLLLDATDEANRWFFDGTILVERHSNEKALIDREDPRLSAGWTRTYASGFFGIKADYQDSSSRIAELQSTGVFVNSDGTQRTRALSANWQHEISPRWTVLTDGAFTNVNYSNSGSLVSYDLSEIASTLTYAYTEKLNTSIKLDFARYRPAQFFNDTNLSHVIFGANYQVKDGFNLAARAGIYNLSGQQSDYGWEGSLAADYIVERMIYRAAISREILPSGVGGFQKTDSLKLASIFNMTEHDRIGANYDFSRYRKDTDINLNALDYQQLGAFYERNLSNHWKSNFSVAHKKLDFPGVASQANVVGVSLIYDALSF